MNPDRAIEIVKSLADGVDPFTGERYPSDSAYQNADIVRALYLALDGLDRVKRCKAKQHDGEGRSVTSLGGRVRRSLHSVCRSLPGRRCRTFSMQQRAWHARGYRRSLPFRCRMPLRAFSTS